MYSTILSIMGELPLHLATPQRPRWRCPPLPSAATAAVLTTDRAPPRPATAAARRAALAAAKCTAPPKKASTWLISHWRAGVLCKLDLNCLIDLTP